MSFSAEHASKLPDNLSGMITNPNHLLNGVSPTALARAAGWEAGARQIDSICSQLEKILDPRARSVLAGTPIKEGLGEMRGGTMPNFTMDNSDVGPKF